MLSMPDRLAALERRIAALEANPAASLRFGSVTEVKGGFARVQLPDGQNMVSALIPTVQSRVLKDQDIKMPDIGEPVACLFAGQGLEAGIVVGACYSPVTPDPNQPPHMDYTKYEDGTEIWYDRTQHKLIAKVKGDSEIEAEGSITAKAQKEIHSESATIITLKAPIIHLAGLLRVTDKDGQPGSGDLRGNYRIVNGNLSVPDGDVTAGKVSLRGHGHENVMNGPSVSGQPVDGRENGDKSGEEAWRERVFDSLPAPLDQLILCLPDIAAMESTRATLQQDKDGWNLLHELMLKWRSKRQYTIHPADKENRIYDNGGQDPTLISWDWLLHYARVQQVWDELATPRYLFSANAQVALAKILRMEGAFAHKHYSFNHSTLPWPQWRSKAFQSASYEYPPVTPPLDGLTASIGRFTIYALADGECARQANNSVQIRIDTVSFFLFDGFDFEGDQGGVFRLGYWRCSPEFDFSVKGTRLENLFFREFRKKTGYGCDFRVIAPPRWCPLEVLPFDFTVKEG